MSDTKTTAPEVQAGPYTITSHVEADDVTFTATLLDSANDGVYEIEFTTTSDSPIPPPALTIEWLKPMVDVHLRWLTKRPGSIPIMPWRSASAVDARATSNAPVYCLHSIDGTNQLTFAISDAINSSRLRATMTEEDAILRCAVEMPSRISPNVTKHSMRLRLDTRKTTFSTALEGVSDWWAEIDECKPMPVPDEARLPMYSTWYSFHLGITPAAIEEQCRLAKPLGMDSVIVDDGWQTEDTERGYAYCGDWEPAPIKFPDFPAHVKRVQDLGVKYMLWLSVPFVGVHSKAWERFQDSMLPGNPEAKWRCLDPRVEKVREYLINIYEHYVRDCGVDGLKLDFVDAFGEPKEDLPDGSAPRRDVSVAEASASLLAEVADRLLAINPNVMLEFRESYIGPAMRRCGNIFRVGDVPNDFPSNRTNSLDLRLLAGNTAVHSDMIMWHGDDSLESAAFQLYHSLFSVPQVSVLIDELSDDHREMLTHYLAFWREHRDLLLDGRLTPIEPGMSYPQAHVRLADKWLAAAFATTVIKLPKDLPEYGCLVNATMDGKVYIEVPDGFTHTRTIKVTNCLGECVREEKIQLVPGLMDVIIPPAGKAILTQPHA